MRRHLVYTIGLALALPCAGAWAVDAPNGAAAAGTELQTPAPANPDAPAPPNQAQPNAATPDQTPPNAVPPNPAAPDQASPNAAPPNAVPPNAEPTNPAPPNAAPPDQGQPAPGNSSAPGEVGTSATPTYYSPLQEFASKNVDEVGELSNQLTAFRAANRPDAVMVLYHMIRDHRLAADAAQNMLARRGDVSTPTITVMPPMASNPADVLQMDIQQHQQMASDLQQMISNANQAADKNLYQKALDATNKHVQWLQSLNQGQQASLGFFGPTTPLGELSGTTAIAAASGYPQPTVTERTAAFRQQAATRRMMRQRHNRRARYGRRGRYSRRSRHHRMGSYRY